MRNVNFEMLAMRSSEWPKCGVRSVNCEMLAMRRAECQLRNEIKNDVISNELRGGSVQRGEKKTYQSSVKRMQGEE